MRLSRFIQNCTLSLSLLLASASVVAESPRNLEDILSRPKQETHEVSPDVIELEKKVKDYNRDTLQPKLNERERKKRAAELVRQKEAEHKRYISMLGTELPKVTKHVVLKEDNYNIPFTIRIEPQGTLEIEPGTRISFGPNAGILCYGGKVIARGTPNKKIIFNAEEESWANITLVESSSRLENCIITQGSGRPRSDFKSLVQHRNRDHHTRINHKYLVGGALALIHDSRSIIKNCEITDNSANKGGGIYLEGAGMTFRNNGGYYNRDLNTFVNMIQGCKIHGNKARSDESPGWGGGIYGERTTIKIGDNEIYENTAEKGGGIYLYEEELYLEGNNIHHNKAKKGGGLHVRNTELVLERCSIRLNDAEEGSGIYDDNRSIRFVSLSSDKVINCYKLGDSKFRTSMSDYNRSQNNDINMVGYKH